MVVKPIRPTYVCLWKSKTEGSLGKSIQILCGELKTHRNRLGEIDVPLFWELLLLSESFKGKTLVFVSFVKIENHLTHTTVYKLVFQILRLI